MSADQHRATGCSTCGERKACASTGLPLDTVNDIMHQLQVLSPELCYSQVAERIEADEVMLRRVIQFLDGYAHVCPDWSDAVA